MVDHEEVVTEQIDSVELQNTIISSTNIAKLKNKRLRMTGLAYKGVVKDEHGHKHFSNQRRERMLMPSKCSRKCEKKMGGRRCVEIEQSSREDIFTLFWRKMDWKQKKVYVAGQVDKDNVKRQREQSRKKMTYKYHLNVKGERIPVCREMFLSTLGLNEKMVYQWVQASELGIPTNVDLEGLPNTTGRGGRTSDAKNHARQFLNDLPKLPSHYCRASTSKHYLEPLFTSVHHVHTEYSKRMVDEGKPVIKLTQFQNLVRDMNISLYRPKKDLCDTCCGYEAKTISESDYLRHIQRKNEARESKNKDKERTNTERNLKVLTVDLQSLLICPKLNASCLYYKMKLSCHNYTVYDLATNKVMCYFWHECEGELSANVFTSCIIDYLKNENLQCGDQVIIYSDGCGYQNRNVTLSNALLQFAIDRKIMIEQKFLERGHTQMECDSVHSVIERSVKNKSIYVPQQYVETIKCARKVSPYRVKYVDYKFFKDYSKCGKYSSIRPGKGVGSETVSDIRVLKYTEGGTIYYKTRHTFEYEQLPEPRKATENLNTQVPPLYSKQLSLKRTKFNHLQQLKSVIPKDYHGFYDTLPYC